MNNRTRSEIEKAFARPDSSRKPIDNIEARSSKIIGGNISGVEKPKRARFGIGWWFSIGIAALVAIVLLIPTPETPIETPSDNLAQLPEKPISDPIYQESRVQEEGESTSKNNDFTSGNDVDRANEFRQTEEINSKIQSLTKKAKETIRKGNYTEPENDNALKHYTEILKISPDNIFALNGVEYITERFAVIGSKHIEKGNLDGARGALASLFSIDSNSEQYIDLSDKITEYELSLQVSPEQKEIEEFKKKAVAALKRSRFTTPTNDNALLYYQKILNIDPENEVATVGVKNLAGRYTIMANEALKNTEFEKAESYVATISAISPEHPSLSLLSNRILQAYETKKSEQITAEIEALKLTNPTEQNPVVTTQAAAIPIEINIEPQPVNLEPQATGIESQPINIEPQQTEVVQNPQQQSFNKQNVNNFNSISNDELDPSPSRELDEVRLKNGLGAYYSGNYQRAIEYLQPLANKGIARAQMRVGYMFYLGRGVNQDRITGVEYLKNAMPAVTQFAQENRAWAQADMGSLFEDGIILQQSYASAVEWYQKAAGQGYAGAQTNLGNMYYGGRGVQQDVDVAVEWFKKAAQNGDAVAKRNLVALGINSN